MDLYTKQDSQVEKRAWLWGPHGTEPGTNPSIELDLAQFPAATYTNGYVPSGTVVTKLGDGRYGAYTPGGAAPAGLLFSSVTVKDGKVTSPNAALYVHGFVNPALLPFTSGPGSLDAAAREALSQIHFE